MTAQQKAEHPPRVRISGSQKRQRTSQIKVALLPSERIDLEGRAGDAGLSLASYLRARALGTPGPRSRRAPPLNAVALAVAVSELKRVGSNLNQIARAVNSAMAYDRAEAARVFREIETILLAILQTFHPRR